MWLKRRLKFLSLLLVAILAVSGLAVSFPGSASANLRDEICPTLSSDIASIRQRISAHNAEPHVFRLPSQQAQYNAYNARAAGLRAEQAVLRVRDRACADAVRKLAREFAAAKIPNPQPKPPTIEKLKKAAQKIPPGWVPPKDVAPTGRSLVRLPKTSPVREIYDILRPVSSQPAGVIGNRPLQGKYWPSIGARDPAYPGRLIGRAARGREIPAVSADHIVSLVELVQLPGFAQLTARQMYQLSRAPLNLQWLSWQANRVKSSGVATRLLPEADAQWVREQIALQEETRKKLQEMIDVLLRVNGK